MPEILKNYSDIKKTDIETQRKTIAIWAGVIKNVFKNSYKVGDLSNIEASHLMRIIESVIKENEFITQHSVDSDFNNLSFNAEIIRRWFWELYSINLENEKLNEELFSRIKFLREQGHNPSLEFK